MKNLLKLIQNKWPIWVIIIVLIAIILILMIWCSRPIYKGEEKIVTIEKNTGSDETGQKLVEENLIRNKWLFVFYVWIKGYSKHLQAGEYLLNPRMSLFEISRIIANGEVNPNWVKITIPEGWTIGKIEERLIFANVLGTEDKIAKENEGYLFPDTYYFYKNSSAAEIIKKMRENFDRKITSEIKQEIKKQSKTLNEIVIMASIIEKEVKTEEDMIIISGVFWKRIKNSQALQSCATIAYILGVDKPQYSYEDTRIKSPYNTYLNLGLPPAPIDNPGLSAIKAAIYPRETDYNFFLTDPATGKTIFSKTLEEHNANKAKYLK